MLRKTPLRVPVAGSNVKPDSGSSTALRIVPWIPKSDASGMVTSVPTSAGTTRTIPDGDAVLDEIVVAELTVDRRELDVVGEALPTSTKTVMGYSIPKPVWAVMETMTGPVNPAGGEPTRFCPLTDSQSTIGIVASTLSSVSVRVVRYWASETLKGTLGRTSQMAT